MSGAGRAERKRVQRILQIVQRRFVLRWTLANMLGWSLGLYAASLGLELIGGFAGVLLAGTVAGLVAASAQTLAGRRIPDWRWMILGAAGGVFAALPVFVATFALIAGRGVGFAVMGAVFGLCFGLAQTFALRARRDAVVVWVLANALGGGACGIFSLAWTPLALPVFCSLGPASFGAITGFALVALHRSGEIDCGEE